MAWADSRSDLPPAVWPVLARLGIRATRHFPTLSVAAQTLTLWERALVQSRTRRFPRYELRRRYRISTAARGTGQVMHSCQTPLGLHRVARKIGEGRPVGTVFQGRQPAGFTWDGRPDAAIVHRILWLEGLEPGINRGGQVDTFARYICMHGFSDELTLGRPRSRGCIHLAARDLIPLFDRLPVGALVWIADR